MEENDKLPVRESIRNKHRNLGWWVGESTHSFTRQHAFRQHLKRFLLKNIGRPYDKVYSEFCQKFPERIGKLDTRAEFRFCCPFESTFCFNKPCHRVEPVYCGSDGIIKATKQRGFKPKPHIDFVDPNEPVFYQLSQSLIDKYPGFWPAICTLLRKEDYERLLVVQDKMTREMKVGFIRKIADTGRWYETFSKLHNLRYWNVPDFSRFFIELPQESLVRVKKGDVEYKQIRAEQSDSQKVRARENQRAMDEKAANLLASIEQDRKEKEKLRNKIKVESHGFDEETSFKGEPYHGRKGKSIR